jgi:hypothetical protein
MTILYLPTSLTLFTILRYGLIPNDFFPNGGWIFLGSANTINIRVFLSKLVVSKKIHDNISRREENMQTAKEDLARESYEASWASFIRSQTNLNICKGGNACTIIYSQVRT